MQLFERLKLILHKKALHQTGYVTIGSLTNGVSLFLLNIILAKRLNQDVFGIFSLSVLTLSTVAEMSDFGLNLGLLRFGPYYLVTNQIDKFKQLVKTIWGWRISLTGILTVGSILLAYPLAWFLFKQPVVAPYLLFTSFGIGGVILLGFLSTYLQARQRFFYQASLQSLKGLLRLVIVVILLLLGVKSLYVYLSVYILIPWILFLANVKVLPEKFTEVKIDEEVKQKLHSQLARFSFWLTLNSLMAILYSRIDQVMISRLLGLREVAIFTIAWQLIQLFTIVNSSISSVLTPRFSSLKNKTELVQFLKRSLKWVIVGAIGIGILIFPSQYIIAFLFGVKYIEAMPLYLILAYGYLLNILVMPFSLSISIFNKTEYLVFSGFVQTVINIVGNIILIPKYGIIGAGFTFIISSIVLAAWNVAIALYLIRKKEIVIV